MISENVNSFVISQRNLDLVRDAAAIQTNESSIKKSYFEGRRVETYTDLVENLTDAQKQNLEFKLNSLPDQNFVLKEVCEALSKGDIRAPIKNFSMYFLLALKKQLIDGLTYTTSQLFLNVLNRLGDKNKAEFVPLFIDAAINPRAWNLIEETLKPFPGSQYKGEIIINNEEDPYPRMTKEQLKVFFDLMRILPPLDQQFILLPDPDPIEKKNVALANTITKRLNHTLFHKFNVFCRLSDKEGKPKRMIPSKGMIQAYLIARFGEHAPTLITNYGLSPFATLKKGIPIKERPFCLNPPPEAELPMVWTADKLACDICANECEYHDFYHGEIFGEIGRDQKKFYACGQFFEQLAKELSPEDKNLELVKKASEKFYDMEHADYKFFAKLDLPSSDLAAPFWSAFTYRMLNMDIKIVFKFINELIDKVDFYKEEYDITLWSLIRIDLKKYKKNMDIGDYNNVRNFQSFVEQAIDSCLSEKTKEDLNQISKNKYSHFLRKKASAILKERALWSMLV